MPPGPVACSAGRDPRAGDPFLPTTAPESLEVEEERRRVKQESQKNIK